MTARVLSVVGSDALVETGHGTEWVAVDLVPDAAPGELLLCHAALALLRVEEDAP
ncbi:MAG: HypC/HybG/HupF family hydrogenase formation chaperone [Gaiella sp.]